MQHQESMEGVLVEEEGPINVGNVREGADRRDVWKSTRQGKLSYIVGTNLMSQHHVISTLVHFGATSRRKVGWSSP